MESDKTKLNNSNKLSKTLNLTAEQIGADKSENEGILIFTIFEEKGI